MLVKFYFIFKVIKIYFVCHAHHKRNVVADILAKDSISNSSGTMFFLNPPAHLILSILDGIAGSLERLMPRLWVNSLVYFFASLLMGFPCNQKQKNNSTRHYDFVIFFRVPSYFNCILKIILIK